MFKRIVLMMLLLALVAGCKSQSKEELLMEGVKLVDQGNHTGSIVLFRSALEKDPNYFEARHRLAQAYIKTGKFDKAEKELQKVLLQSPDNGDIPLELAELYNATEKPDLAIEQVNKYLSGHDKTSRAIESLGRSHAIKGDMAAAEGYYREAITLDPGNFSARLDLCRVFLIGNRAGEARAQLEEILRQDGNNIPAHFALARLEARDGNRDAALALYRKIAKIDSNNVEALFMAGVLLLDSGEPAEAGRIAAELQGRFPKHPAGVRLQGMVDYLNGDYEQAVVNLQNSLKSLPDLVGHYFLGLTHYKLEQFELALNQFQAGLDVQPDHAQSRLMVAMTLLKQKRLDDAIAETVKVVHADPRNGLAHNIMGSAYLAKGDFDQAMKNLDKAIEIDPTLADAHLKKGLFSLAQGNPIQAEAGLVKAIQIAPEHLNTRLLLASYYLRQQNYPGAIATLQEGLTGKDEDALLYNYMAAAYLAQKKNVEAVEALQKAKKIRADYFAPYFNLAGFYAAANEPDKALAEYRAILHVDAQNLQALLRMAALQELSGDAEGALVTLQAAKQTGQAEGFLALARLHARQGNMSQALEVLNAAYTALPANPEILEMRGKLLVDRSQLEEAKELFQELEKAQAGKGLPLLIAVHLRQGEVEKAIALAQGRIDAAADAPYGYWLLASVYEKLGDRAKAQTVIEKGLAAVKDQVTLRMKLAALHAADGRSDQAVGIYEAIIAESPDFVAATFALGALHDGLGDKRKARKFYQDVLAKDENFTPALNNLAYLHAENYGDPKEALTLALKAYRNAPADPSVLDTLGYVLVKNGRAEEAIKVLEKAAAMLPDVPAVQLHLGQAYKAAGKKNEAIGPLETVVEKGQADEVKVASALLEELKQ
ncbi:lipoprotein [Desulfuromonas versatilis]|uniref:Lipoprotein n=1 Tax=Desulfuromonas versatilis TaxID=2802975 RepID=A0ABN6DZ17_9BACT|nr:XrtA/PEP-CTERM system TPR-repeat protein PrsT [Desulfuromonas versatilis]BCR05292.1 lipoprotein [Desulfuromonas versatilis]